MILSARQITSAADAEEIRTQLTVGLDVAGRALGIGRSSTYKAARDGTIPTIKIGAQYRVPTVKLRQMLGISPES